MKNNFFQSAAMHGLIIGLALIVFSLLDWALGFYGQNTGFSLLTYVIIFCGLLWAGFSYRKSLGGYISYGQAFGYSVMVAAFFAFVSTIFSLILTNIIDPTYMERIMEFTEQKLLEAGLPESQIDNALEMSKKFSNPAITFIIGFLGSTFFSTIIALITSAIVKRNNPNPFAEQEQI